MLDALMAVGYSASRLIDDPGLTQHNLVLAANNRFILQRRLDVNPKPSQMSLLAPDFCKDWHTID